MTLEEFVNLLGQSKSIEARLWIEQFKLVIDLRQWEETKGNPLNRANVISIARFLANLIRGRIISIGTEELYKEVIEQGHAFLREIHQKAVSQGIEVKEDEIDSFLSYTEMMAAVGYIKIEDNKVTLTEKGEKAALNIEREIRKAERWRISE
jgi:hypothetical protein